MGMRKKGKERKKEAKKQRKRERERRNPYEEKLEFYKLKQRGLIDKC